MIFSLLLGCPKFKPVLYRERILVVGDMGRTNVDLVAVGSRVERWDLYIVHPENFLKEFDLRS